MKRTNSNRDKGENQKKTNSSKFIIKKDAKIFECHCGYISDKVPEFVNHQDECRFYRSECECQDEQTCLNNQKLPYHIYHKGLRTFTFDFDRNAGYITRLHSYDNRLRLFGINISTNELMIDVSLNIRINPTTLLFLLKINNIKDFSQFGNINKVNFNVINIFGVDLLPVYFHLFHAELYTHRFAPLETEEDIVKFISIFDFIAEKNIHYVGENLLHGLITTRGVYNKLILYLIQHTDILYFGWTHFNILAENRELLELLLAKNLRVSYKLANNKTIASTPLGKTYILYKKFGSLNIRLLANTIARTKWDIVFHYY